MSYPKQLVRLRPIGGQVRDVPAWEVGLNNYTRADNVHFRMGFAERIDGERLAYDPPQIDDLRDLVNIVSNGQIFWVYVGGTAQFAVTGAVHSDITNLLGVTFAIHPQMHSLFVFNGVVIHNNSLDDPMYWPGAVASPFVNLPDWPTGTRALKMAPHKYHLFAMALEEAGGSFPSKIIWSAAAEPGTVPSSWTPAADNEAGDVELADTAGAIFTAATLRDSLLIYKRNAIYQANYVGGNQVYEFRPLFRNVGALNPRAVAATDNGHFLLADNDILFTDGISLQSLAHGRVRRSIFAQVNAATFERAFVVYYRPKNEAWVCIPESGQEWATRAFVYSFDNDAWSEREMEPASHAAVGLVNDATVSEAWDDDPDAWDTDSTLWSSTPYSVSEQMLLSCPVTTADPDPRFILVDAGTSQAFDATIARHDMTFDQPERIKYVRRLHVRRDAPGGGDMFVRVGARMNPDDAIIWEPEVTMSGEQFLNVSVLGRYISFELRTDDVQLWKVTGVDLEVEFRGYH